MTDFRFGLQWVFVAQQVGEHVYPLDPHEPEAGVLDGRWRIPENVDVFGEL